MADGSALAHSGLPGVALAQRSHGLVWCNIGPALPEPLEEGTGIRANVKECAGTGAGLASFASTDVDLKHLQGLVRAMDRCSLLERLFPRSPDPPLGVAPSGHDPAPGRRKGRARKAVPH